ncbi:TPA: restriction endonuclease subunit S [Haemophilus influenzae]
MNNQEFIPASEFCDLVTDGTHDSPKKTEFGVKLVTSKNIVGGKLDLTSAYFISESDAQNINKRSQVHINDVLLSMIGTVGEVALIEKEPDFVIKNVGLLKNSDPKKAKWLYYYLKSPITQNLIKDRLRGTTQQYIPLGELRNLPILKPNSEEHLQNTIEQLSSLDKKIQLNTQINQTLEQIAQALFKSWFVDFDPVRTKVQALSDGLSLEQAELAAMQTISGKTPEELTALSQTQPEHYAELAETAKAFPCEMVEVDGVKVPKGWKIQYLKDICNIVYGKNLPTTKLIKEGYPVFGGNGVIGYYDKFLYETPQTLVSCRGAASGKVLYSLSYSFVTNNSLVIEHEKSGLSYFYIYETLKLQNLTELTSGSAQPQMTIANMAAVQILVPSEKINEVCKKYLGTLYNQIYQNNIENETLANTRDLLLPKLLKGEV